MVRNHYLVAVIIITAGLGHIQIFLESKKANKDYKLSLGLLFISFRLPLTNFPFTLSSIRKEGVYRVLKD